VVVHSAVGRADEEACSLRLCDDSDGGVRVRAATVEGSGMCQGT